MKSTESLARELENETKKINDIKNQLNEVNITNLNHYVKEIEKYNKEINEKKAKIEKEEKEINLEKSEIENGNKEIKQREKKLEEDLKKLTQMQEELKKDKIKYAQKQALYEEKLKQFTQNKQQYEKEIEQHKLTVQKLEREMINIKNEFQQRNIETPSKEIIKNKDLKLSGKALKPEVKLIEKNEKEEALISAYIKQLISQKRIKIVTILGNKREGKSTLLNYLTMENLGIIKRGGFENINKNQEIFETDKKTSDSELFFYSIPKSKFQQMHLPYENNDNEEDYDIIFVESQEVNDNDSLKESKNYLISLLSILKISSLIIDLSTSPISKVDRLNEIQRNLTLKEIINDGDYENLNVNSSLECNGEYMIIQRSPNISITDEDEEKIEDITEPEDIAKYYYELYSNYDSKAIISAYDSLSKEINIKKDNLLFFGLPEIYYKQKETFFLYKKIVQDIAKAICLNKNIKDGEKCFMKFKDTCEIIASKFKDQIQSLKMNLIFKSFIEYKLTEIENQIVNELRIKITDELAKKFELTKKFEEFGTFFDIVDENQVTNSYFSNEILNRFNVLFLESIPFLKNVDKFSIFINNYQLSSKYKIKEEIKEIIKYYKNLPKIDESANKYLEEHKSEAFPFELKERGKNKEIFPKGLNIFLLKKSQEKRNVIGKNFRINRIRNENEIKEEITNKFKFDPYNLELIPTERIKITNRYVRLGFFGEFSKENQSIQFLFDKNCLVNEKKFLEFENGQDNYLIEPPETDIFESSRIIDKIRLKIYEKK